MSARNTPKSSITSPQTDLPKNLDLPGAIVQRSGELTRRDIEKIGSTPLINLGSVGDHPELMPFLIESFRSVKGLQLFSGDAVKSLGKPNATIRTYESRPSAWVFDDSSGITFVIYSDGLNKNPWKGTSYEASVPKGTPSKDVESAITRLFDIVKKTSAPSASDNLYSSGKSGEVPRAPSAQDPVGVTIHFKGDIRRIFQASESLKSIAPDVSDSSVRQMLNEAIALINKPDAKGFLQIDLPKDNQRMAQAKEKLSEVLSRIDPKHKDIIRLAISDLR